MADASSLVVMTNLCIGQMFGSTDLVHMPAAVITGLGFLGVGTILVTKSHTMFPRIFSPYRKPRSKAF